MAGRKPRGREALHGQLPGGRAPPTGPDAYQFRETDIERRQSLPGLPFRGDGRLIEGVTLAAGETQLVRHNLRRPFVGAVPLNIRARPCSFRAYLSANQTGVSTADKIEFDTESYDYGSVFNTTSNTFTAPVAGVYEITARLHAGNLSNGEIAIITLDVNGTNIQLVRESQGSNTPVRLSATEKILLNAGSNVTLEYEFSGGGTQTVLSGANSTVFAAEIVGSPVPYIDSGYADGGLSAVIPIHAERPLTCDIWVY